MSVCVVIPLEPGRYVVRGGTRGETVIQHVMRDVTADSARALHRGRVVVRNTARDRWPILAAFRVRPGQHVTSYGALDAVARVWTYGGNS